MSISPPKRRRFWEEVINMYNIDMNVAETDMDMRRSPRANFVHFVLGFLLLISLSTGMTIYVGKYDTDQASAQRASAAQTMMFKTN